MVRRKGACEKCVRTCQLLHGCKRDSKPMVSRFMKIMIGADFNEALFLPPKFVKNVEDLVGQETKLEDSTGICWTVALSYYKGKLAFHKGWDKFSYDKGLMVGDMLLFNRIKDGPFVVHVFGRDACEKLNMARKYPPVKKARIGEKKFAENTSCHTTHKDARKTTSSGPFVQMQSTKLNCNPKCEAQNREQLCIDNDLCMMVDRDAGYVHCGNRTWLYDLSNFEMQQNTCPVGTTKERIDGQEFNPDAAQRSVKFQSDWGLNDNGTNEIMVSSMQTAVTPNTNIVRGTNNSEPTCNMSDEHEDPHLDDLKIDHPLASVKLDVIEGDDILNVAVLPQSPQMKGGDLPQCPQNRSRNFKEEIEMVKKVKIEIGEETYGCGQKRASVPSTIEEDDNTSAASEKSKTVRIVPVNTFGVPSTSSVTYLAQTNGSNIGLAESWPTVTFPVNGEGRITVTLEDPKGREWAGVHCENCGFRALHASWDKIKAKNNIQPGDHLVFSSADKNMSKYKFSIVRKQFEN